MSPPSLGCSLTPQAQPVQPCRNPVGCAGCGFARSRCSTSGAAGSVLDTSALSHSLLWGQSCIRQSKQLPEMFVSPLYQICHMQQCPAALPVLFLPAVAQAEGLTLPASLCPRPSVRVETQPALDLQHYRDSHSGPLQYIFWRQMLRSICPGEHITVRDGCAGCGGPGMLCRGNMQLVKCHA